jgi:diguanylate cyclase
MTGKDGVFRQLVLGSLTATPEVVRDRLLATVLQTPISLALSSIAILLVSFTAAQITDARWAWGWFAFSFGVVTWRVIYPLVSEHLWHRSPLVSIMVTAALLFMSFGLGCAACITTGDVALTAMSMAGVMGVVAGLATRWAALPRAAISVMVLTAAPPVFALASRGGANVVAALAIAFVVVTIAAFTVHNQNNLVSAITAEELSRRMARTDPLTGLANRGELMRCLTEACQALRAKDRFQQKRFAVLYMDLDGFKSVNDNFGHATGDELLRRVSQCLCEAVGADQLVSRIGGDEFVALLHDADELTARAVADELIAAVSREHELPSGHKVSVGCSVGVSLAPDQGSDPDLLMARADSALYEIKNQGKGHSGLWRTLA